MNMYVATRNISYFMSWNTFSYKYSFMSEANRPPIVELIPTDAQMFKCEKEIIIFFCSYKTELTNELRQAEPSQAEPSRAEP